MSVVLASIRIAAQCCGIGICGLYAVSVAVDECFFVDSHCLDRISCEKEAALYTVSSWCSVGGDGMGCQIYMG